MGGHGCSSNGLLLKLFRFFGKAEEDFYEHLGLLDLFVAKEVIMPRLKPTADTESQRSSTASSK